MADGTGQREPGRDAVDEDAAERAFEELRAEVAAQRRVLERLDGLIRQGQGEAATSAPTQRATTTSSPPGCPRTASTISIGRIRPLASFSCSLIGRRSALGMFGQRSFLI